MIYLDNASNVKSKKEVLDLFIKIESMGLSNANSLHQGGKEAFDIVSDYQNKIYELLNISKDEYDIIHTSSGTESNNLAIKGYANSHSGFGRHILVSPLEHSSVNATLGYLKDNNFEIEFIPVNNKGQIDIAALNSLIRKDTILVIINLVDSEAGFIQDYKEISCLCHKKGVTLFMDIVQGFGKFDINYHDLDMFSISPHKFGGLLGTGLLIKRKDIILTPLIHGGKSLNIYRSGSIPISLIASTYKAIEIALSNRENNYKNISNLRDYLFNYLKNNKNILINSPDNNPYIINLSINGYKGNEVVNYLSDKGIYVSQKAACNITSTPSKVIMSVYNDKKRAYSSFRISLNEDNTKEDIDELIRHLEELTNGK